MLITTTAAPEFRRTQRHRASAAGRPRALAVYATDVFRASLVAIAIVPVLATTQPAKARDVMLQTLTVPPERLPSGCRLSADDGFDDRGVPPHGGSRIFVRNSLPAVLFGVTMNPWIGTDRPIVARIRERMESPPDVPDAAPLSPGSAARYLLRWAEGVEEGYAASYVHPEAKDTLVLALRFAATERQRPHPNPAHDERISHIVIGRTVAFVYGDGSPCFRTVEAHLKSLER